MEVEIGQKSTKWPPGDVSEAIFLRKRPTFTKHCQAWSKRMSGPHPESSICAPFGSKSRPKALLERRLKNVSNKMPKSHQKLPKWSPKRVTASNDFATFGFPNATLEPEGARRCPGPLKTPMSAPKVINSDQNGVPKWWLLRTMLPLCVSQTAPWSQMVPGGAPDPSKPQFWHHKSSKVHPKC